MRAIKFRAWDTDELVMRCPMAVTPDGYAYADWGKDKPHWKLMQCTGLKDKNGREIYEGDVLRGKEYSTDEDEYEVIVEYEIFSDGDGFACAGYNPNFDSEWDFEKTGIINAIIIGNIYENPELKPGA